MIDSVAGVGSAAPTLWTTRRRSQNPAEEARPDTSHATPNKTSTTMKKRLARARDRNTGRHYYAACRRDPDGLRVEVVSRS